MSLPACSAFRFVHGEGEFLFPLFRGGELKRTLETARFLKELCVAVSSTDRKFKAAPAGHVLADFNLLAQVTFSSLSQLLRNNSCGSLDLRVEYLRLPTS